MPGNIVDNPQLSARQLVAENLDSIRVESYTGPLRDHEKTAVSVIIPSQQVSRAAREVIEQALLGYDLLFEPGSDPEGIVQFEDFDSGFRVLGSREKLQFMEKNLKNLVSDALAATARSGPEASQ